MTLDVLNIIQARCQRVIDIDDNDLPICLLLIEKSHDTKDLDLLDLAWRCNELADFADIERIVVTFCLGFGMGDVGIFPCLYDAVSVGSYIGRRRLYLRESPIIPEVSFVGEAIADVAKLALLHILLDGVQGLLLRDLRHQLAVETVTELVTSRQP